MKGKWALGIPPRHFTWVLKNKLAICERPGGYASNHRRVRRQEEIIWIRENRFDCVMSLITSPHNLHNYDELGVQWRHRPFNGADDGPDAVLALYRELQALLRDNKKVIVHREELGDHVVGLMAGYLLWSGLVSSGPEVITVIERIAGRQLGPIGRELVAQAEALRTGAVPPPAGASSASSSASADEPARPAGERP